MDYWIVFYLVILEQAYVEGYYFQIYACLRSLPWYYQEGPAQNFAKV